MANKTVYQIIAKAVGFKDSERAAKGLKESLGGLKTAAMGVAGAYFGSQALIGGIRASIEAFGQQEAAEKKLEVALGRTSDRLLKQASALQALSTEGDEAIIMQQAFLGSIGMTEDQISDIIPVALDLAAATGMTLESAVRNTAKTFSGLAGELGELVPQIRDLTAEEMKAGEAVKVMGDLFKGQALSSTKTFEGQVAQLQNALGDIGETIGGLLVDNGVLSGLVNWATEADEAFSFFFGTLDDKKKPLTDTETSIESITQKMDHQMSVMAEWAQKSTDEDFIREQANMRMKTEDEIRQSIADTIVRHAETYNELNAELERTREHQEFLAENLPLVNEAQERDAEILNDILPAKMMSNDIDIKKIELSSKVREMTDKEFASYKRLVAAKKVGAAIEVAASSQIFGSFAALAGATGENAELVKNLTIAQAIADTYAGANKAYAQGGALGIATGTALIAAGLANVIQIESAYKEAQSKKGAQYGFEGVVDEPTQFTVGEGGQAEYVSVTPMEGVNNAGGGSQIIIQGNVMTDEFVEEELAEKIADAVRRGTNFGIS